MTYTISNFRVSYPIACAHLYAEFHPCTTGQSIGELTTRSRRVNPSIYKAYLTSHFTHAVKPERSSGRTPNSRRTHKLRASLNRNDRLSPSHQLSVPVQKKARHARRPSITCFYSSATFRFTIRRVSLPPPSMSHSLVVPHTQ